MSEYATFERMAALLISLLDSPAVSWSKQSLDDIRIEVECGEYENPLGNIIAIGLQSKQGFDASALEKLDTLIQLMDLEDTPWVVKLRQYERSQGIAPGSDET